MGLDTVLVVGILAVGMVAIIFMLSGSVVENIDTVSGSYRMMNDNQLDKLNTRMEIGDIVKDDVGYLISIRIENTGSVKISDFDKMDVIIYGDGWIERLKYNSGSIPNPGEWSKTIVKDVLNPGILDPGEVMEADLYPLHISYLVPDAATYIKVVAPNGVETTKKFDNVDNFDYFKE
ncbi:MAG TPA: hypothetical protein HA221_01290 [Halobacteria archaeon]|jgi:archaellum component FlaF (FlaF/FlaG flagellin family)|nr:hypothetical protein [Halobacteria archaeon]